MNASASDVSANPGPARRVNPLSILAILIRREFWEHRVLWIAPLAMAALYILICLIPGHIDIRGISIDDGPASPGGSLFLKGQMIFTAVLFTLMSVVVFFYLAESLYAERKDRSILFWKSMPVSDLATVMSKLLVALVVVPLGVYLLAIVTHLVAMAILFVRLHGNPALAGFLSWDVGGWLRINGVLLLYTAILALWFAPLAAYQLLVSAWARSSVLVWTVLPPLILIFGEKLFFNTWNIAWLIGQRFGMGFSGFARSGQGSFMWGSTARFSQFDPAGFLTNPQLWIGLVVAAVLVFGAVRIRRYRDDS